MHLLGGVEDLMNDVVKMQIGVLIKYLCNFIYARIKRIIISTSVVVWINIVYIYLTINL